MTQANPERLADLFERVATQFAGRTALDIPPSSARAARTTLTYAELRQRAELAARSLEPWLGTGTDGTPQMAASPSSGAAPGPRDEAIVVIFLPRESPWLYAAQLGAWYAGAAFCCLDPRFPDEHLASVLADAGPAAVITDERGAARLAARRSAASGLVVVERIAFEAASDVTRGRGRRGKTSSTGRRDGSSLAYIVYTSGTTGQPKGVMIEHRSIANLVAADVEAFGLGPGDRVAQVSSPAYDSSIEEAWLAFGNGATLVVLDDETVRLGPDLVPWLHDERINVLCPPPTLLRATGCANPRDALPELKLLYVGGEALPQDIADLWAEGRWMENGYGPTECTVTVVRGRIASGRPVTIGRPVRGHRAWVVNDALGEVPAGESGELVIGGIGLARGYHRRPDLTAERFVDHPAFGRIYRSGDLVRLNAGGELEYLGRLDGQVKLRGYRIELGAVEAALAGQAGVRAAGCVVHAQGGREELVAFVVPMDAARPLDLESLRATLLRQLPEYMVPARIGILNGLPTTVGGKLDRRALAEIGLPARRADRPPRGLSGGVASPGPSPGAISKVDLQSQPAVARRGESAVSRSGGGALRAAIAAAFAEALGLDDDDVRPEDDFFLDLGGDSLSAVGVIVTLRAMAGADRGAGKAALASLAVRDVYEARTVAGLAERARARDMSVSAACSPRPGALPREDGGAPTRPFSTLLATAEERREELMTEVMPTSAGSVALEHASNAAAAGERSPRPTRALSPAMVTMLQCAWLTIELVIASAASFVAAYEWLPRVSAALGVAGLALAAPFLAMAAILAYLPLSVAITVLVKRVVIGRYRPQRVPVWSAFYLRHWIVAHTARHIPWTLLEGTVFYGAVLRMLGAKVGQRVHVHRGVELRAGGWDLLALGDDVTLSQEAAPRLVTLEGGHLVIGPIAVGDGATIEVRAGLSAHSVVEAQATLTALSWLPAGARIPRGERWDGVPAVRAGSTPPRPQVTPDVGVAAASVYAPARHGALMIALQCLWWGVGFLPLALGAFALSAVRPDAAAALGAWIHGHGDSPASRWAWINWLALACCAVPISLVVHALELRCLGRVKPGVYDRWGPGALRIWLKSGIVDAAGSWLSGSLFWPTWLRAAGMRIGRGSEISTIIDVLPETVAIGEESFFADGIYFCSPRVDRGTVTVRPTSLGSNTFLGNHAVIPAGHAYPDDYFIGVATVADAEAAERAGRGGAKAGGNAWFGHPPLRLPRREVIAADRRLTHEPEPARYWTRVFWELSRFTLPALPLTVLLGWYAAAGGAAERVPRTALVVLWLPMISLLAITIECGVVVAMKWLLLGRVKPGQHAFWSCWCGRWDFMYVAWSFLVRPLLSELEGTLLLNEVLKLAGARIGRRVVLGSGFAQVVDPDMLAFEDDATVACQFQAHSFEDRILKIDRSIIRRGATVGPSAVVFYGADIGADALVAPHSVVMKHDVLPAGGRYAGNPVRVETAVVTNLSGSDA